MNTDAEKRLTEGLRNNTYHVVAQIYDKNLPLITNYVLQNRGSKEDAKDVFQDGLVILFNRLQDPSFHITTSMNNYLFGICKFVWMRKLKKKSRQEVSIASEDALLEDTSIESDLLQEERRQFYREKFRELSEECKTVLQSFFDGVPLRDIAAKMGYSDSYAKRKKYKCKETLATLIKQDSRYSEHL